MKVKVFEGRKKLTEMVVNKNGFPEEINYLMKVKYNGKSDPLYFINGKTYYVIDDTKDYHVDLYSIIDETGEAYHYSLEGFEIIEKIN